MNDVRSQCQNVHYTLQFAMYIAHLGTHGKTTFVRAHCNVRCLLLFAIYNAYCY